MPHGVEVVHWPADAVIRRQLARVGVPRVLLVPAGVQPPDDLDPAETWLPTDAAEHVVVDAARRLVDSLRLIDGRDVWIDLHGVVHRGEQAVALSASEALVAGELLAAGGRVVSRDRLQQLLGSDHERSDRAVEAVIYRLRRRLVALHLVVRTVRSRGFVIDRR